MKQLTSVLLFFLFMLNANSQVTKGVWLLGGNASFSHDNYSYQGEKIISSEISLAPKVGLFVADRFAAGLTTNYRWVSNTNNGIKTSSNSYGIGPFARYYLLPVERTTNLLVEGKFLYNGQGNSTVSTTSSFLSYGLLAGPEFFLNTSVGIEVLAGYEGYKETGNDARSSGFKLVIGFQFHLEKEK